MTRPPRTLLPGLIGAALCFSLYGAQHDRDGQVLARVEVANCLSEIPLPVYAHLQDSQGQDYALVKATLSELERSQCSYRVLDKAVKGSDYAIAIQRDPSTRVNLNAIGNVILNDGCQVILRASQDRSEALEHSTLDFEWLSETPIATQAPIATLQDEAPVQFTPVIESMIQGVTEEKVSGCVSQLSGAEPVEIGGTQYTIKSRNTNSGEPIEKATQCGYEFMQEMGLQASYQKWSRGRNVIGEKPGTSKADEIVVIVAHLDDMPASGIAPGADDNASGSTGVLLAAEAIRSQSFERTIRCVLVTGEEQGLLGSAAYAKACKEKGEKLVAVFNMDMIGTDTRNQLGLRLTTRSQKDPGHQGDMAIINIFKDILSTYKIPLKPEISNKGGGGSDHASFWKAGFPAVFAIEKDFSKNYHKSTDTLDKMSLPFCTAVIKAAVGTVAQMAVPTASFTFDPQAITRTACGRALSPASWTISYR